MNKFSELGLDDWVLDALAKKGYETPTPIQAAVIPKLLGQDHDIIGQAQTGTGKTAAFGLPIIQKVKPGLRKVQALILCPTRELALQVTKEVSSFAGDRGLQTVTLYGGAPIYDQKRALSRGVDIVIATPGRCIDFLTKGHLNLDLLQYLVLDEADEMLDMGFLEDVETILDAAPEERTVLMFSATMPHRLKKVAESYLRNSVHVAIEASEMTHENITQIGYEVMERDKLEALGRLLDLESDFYGIIFCRTRVEVERVSANLFQSGHAADFIHGDVPQASRERLLQRFRAKEIKLLIATDVAARGIDISDLSHVVNFTLPEQPETYVHRIGRTGRAGKAGKAFSLSTPAERNRIRQIERRTKAPIKFEVLPSGQAVVNARLDMFRRGLDETLDQKVSENYYTLAAELLKDRDADQTLALLLTSFFGDEFEPTRYRDLTVKKGDRRDRRDRKDSRGDSRRDRRDSRDSRGDSRERRDSRDSRGREFKGERKDRFEPPAHGTKQMYFGKGRIDGLNAGAIIKEVCTQSGIDGKSITRLRVMDKFATFSVEESKADTLINKFEKNKRGGRAILRYDRNN